MVSGGVEKGLGHDMLRLSEQEKQEIVRFLEAGKELPEKYRFLLFEESFRQKSFQTLGPYLREMDADGLSR